MRDGTTTLLCREERHRFPAGRTQQAALWSSRPHSEGTAVTAAADDGRRTFRPMRMLRQRTGGADGGRSSGSRRRQRETFDGSVGEALSRSRPATDAHSVAGSTSTAVSDGGAPAGDQTVATCTDDEATLTSVRRIVAGAGSVARSNRDGNSSNLRTDGTDDRHDPSAARTSVRDSPRFRRRLRKPARHRRRLEHRGDEQTHGQADDGNSATQRSTRLDRRPSHGTPESQSDIFGPCDAAHRARVSPDNAHGSNNSSSNSSSSSNNSSNSSNRDNDKPFAPHRQRAHSQNRARLRSQQQTQQMLQQQTQPRSDTDPKSTDIPRPFDENATDDHGGTDRNQTAPLHASDRTNNTSRFHGAHRPATNAAPATSSNFGTGQLVTNDSNRNNETRQHHASDRAWHTGEEKFDTAFSHPDPTTRIGETHAQEYSQHPPDNNYNSSNYSSSNRNNPRLRINYSSDYETVDGTASIEGRMRSHLVDSATKFNGTSTARYLPATNLSSSRQRSRNTKTDDDDRTFDYGDRDDNLARGFAEVDDDDYTNGSESYVSRQRREAEHIPRIYRQVDEKYMMREQADTARPTPISESPLLSDDDADHYPKSMDTPAARAGLGVVGVAAVGTICMMGSVGLVIGAAALGAGVVAMQMPEEERNKLHDKAKKKIAKVHEQAMDASERLGSSCAVRYHESGLAEHIDPCFPIKEASSQVELEPTQSESTRRRRKPPSGASPDPAYPGPTHPSTTTDAGEGKGSEGTSPSSQFNLRFRNKKVACLRNVRIVPVGQIYSLDPQSQPKAWLDVLASANTTVDEKIEAMEEISILAKDKRLARLFLDEGILDFFLFTIRLHQDKTRGKETGESDRWLRPDISPRELHMTRLSAQCCMMLGKAHCAAVHTEGDLLLMSMYERGTVPEERQLAQMLVEVPHHTRVTKRDDPTVVEPSKEVFALKHMTLPQAEQMARAIQQIAVGR